eukprot:gnl/TRDRNA2_/TRDRNA2_142526_c1_seq1.p1 gnl/TRDRNA2_/TRDRNA2_142526_c1~~gnl/TRDRNA2_/TRDRNA2_142526_c1_seq1.p1  ORF type:complete len:312 (-),score=13.12 gnl/TRDRNA2_/TRDRNA2_142526_c1_seq1:359-1255(-)
MERAVACCHEAEQFYAGHFQDANCSHCQDARHLVSKLEAYVELSKEICGQPRCSQDPCFPQNTFVIERVDLLPIPGASEATTENWCASELLLGPCTDLLADIQNVAPYPGTQRCRLPERPMAIFLTGPYCAFRNDDVDMLKTYIASTFSTDIDYPPLEYMISCPGCFTRVDSLISPHADAAVFLCLEHVSCCKRGWQQNFELRYVTSQKVIPRTCCLRCIRDVIMPLARNIPTAASDVKWAHGCHLFPAEMDCFSRAFDSWVRDFEYARSGLNLLPRQHHVEHLYYWMNKVRKNCFKE